jgi:hypothetical protein
MFQRYIQRIELEPVEVGARIGFHCPDFFIYCEIVGLSGKAAEVKYQKFPFSVLLIPRKMEYPFKGWIPRSAIINDALGCLTVKSWFAIQFKTG